MIRKVFLFVGLVSPLMAQQPTLRAVTTNAVSGSAIQSTISDPVQSELDAQKLKLKMPIGSSTVSFDLSDSARQEMIVSPTVLNFSDQIQLTKQDSVVMLGLMDLPIASLSELVSKMDFYTQIRFIRFGLLQINTNPQDARLYASKLYILTDEIFPRKAIQDSLAIEAARADERLKIQKRSVVKPVIVSIKDQSPKTSSSWLPSLLLLVLAGAGGYYWFVMRPLSKKALVNHNTSPEELPDPETAYLTDYNSETHQPQQDDLADAPREYNTPTDDAGNPSNDDNSSTSTSQQVETTHG